MLISVPATSANLGPGFDCLGLSLDFRNYFSMTPAQEESIRILGEGEHYNKLKADNIFVRIFNESLQRLGGERGKFAFEFRNKIPISRGLGSSSAVISAAIGMAHLHHYGKIDKSEMLNLALQYEHHPDNITPAIFGGFNAAVVESSKAEGNKVVHLSQPIPDDIRAVVLIPNRSISTKYSRQTLPKKYSNTDGIYNLSRSSLLCMAFMQHKWELLRIASKDRFHQYRRMKQYPVLFSVQKFALENGALMSTLSGSGSSFLSVCFREDSRKLTEAMKARFPHFVVLDLAFDNEGLRIEKD